MPITLSFRTAIIALVLYRWEQAQNKSLVWSKAKNFQFEKRLELPQDFQAQSGASLKLPVRSQVAWDNTGAFRTHPPMPLLCPLPTLPYPYFHSYTCTHHTIHTHHTSDLYPHACTPVSYFSHSLVPTIIITI